ncbi:MAG: cytochrome b N-terminal domain-containing protein [Candidatus Adiutrix sp.]|nr:cytochrome b N-terminal domain-containing protein [Candidatus Adiutrix sp.]
MGRIYQFIDQRLNLTPLWREIADYPVPDHANPGRTPLAFIYCFGGISFFIILLQFLTGMFLMLYYSPSPDHAYASVSYIKNEVLFGGFVQNLHRVGSSAVIFMVFIHMMRVFFTKSYKNPRELNWVAGVFLLFIISGFGFTGYLLPWDQKAFWATAVGLNMIETVPLVGDLLAEAVRGGGEVGTLTLGRFFMIHVMLLPALLIAFLGAHFFMVRRQGISGPL